MDSFYTSLDSELFKNSGVHFVLTKRYCDNAICSNKIYDNFNLAYHVGDNASEVKTHRDMLINTHYAGKKLLYLNQVHSNSIAMANKNLVGDEILMGDFDGIICDSKKFVAMIMVADCNPILIYSPSSRVFALLHAGRMGVTLKIVSNAVKILKEKYNATDLMVFIGASIRGCCYEISKDLSRTYDSAYISSDFKLDMIAMLKDEMKECGILESKIEIMPNCSCCDEEYFSYRREKVTGRFGLFAALN